MNKQFQIARSDGRSNSQVILDLVRGAEPGRVFSYHDLGAALSVGMSRQFEIQAIRSVVRTMLARLLKEERRVLQNVPGVGYRLAFAGDHRQLSDDRKRRATAQLKRGLLILENVRWDEMDENQRAAHQGQLMVVGAMYAMQQMIDRRQRRQDQTIAELRRDVDEMKRKHG
jgi:hypothetical protein